MSSLYVHIPFCSHICSYCDFAKVFYKEDWVNQYLEALEFEIKDKHINSQFDTIYIGGGTPSSLSLEQLNKLLFMLEPFSSNVKEYSIEVNPESMNNDKLELMAKYGINRLSIGVQSFNDNLLKQIDRFHTSNEAILLIENAKERGFKDINIDLMYGLPNQSLEDIKKDIDILSNLNVSHVSIYSLILEENTKLKNNNYKPLEDEEDSLWYDYINNELKKHGFIHYEVSNYYRIKPSIHNLVYWHYKDYEGIGLGAHSLKDGVRYENTRSLMHYLNNKYLLDKTIIEKEDSLFEKIMMGLRLVEGLSIKEMNDLYCIDFVDKYSSVIDKYTKLDMLKLSDGHLRTTKEGMKFLNSILIDFL